MNNKLSVIITVRGTETYLPNTIKNIREKAGCKAEIVCVYDGTQPDYNIEVDQIIHLKHAVGVGGARHAGIEKAANDIIFLTDAHMDFSEGFGKMIVKHYKKKETANDLTCGCCVPLFESGGKLFWNRAEKCTGARFNFISDEPGNEKWVMSGKWAVQTPGEIGCVYGACYSFRRSHYEKIGSPLALLTGWGMDEEYLSAGTWLSGGSVILLDYEAGHLFRARPSFDTGRIDALYRQLNRVRFVEMLPANDKDKRAMNIALALNSITANSEFESMIEQDMARPEVKRAYKLWSSWTWDKIEKWIDRTQQPLKLRIDDAKRRRIDPVTTSQQRVIPNVQMRGVFYCPKCANINSFRVDKIVHNATEICRYGKCRRCGLRGVKITRDNFERIKWNGQE